jgi:MFS family permease
MIVSRLLQGIGGGGIIAMSVTTIADLFPLKERSKYLSLLWANLGVATVIGPMIGGQFTDHLSWRWCFFINIPIGGVASLLIYHQMSRFPITNTCFQWHLLGPLDYPGLMCFMVFTISLLSALSLGGIDYPWTSSVVIGCFIGAIVGLLMFIKVE